MFREIKLGLQRYWRWTSTGPKWHWVAGIGGPLLALLIVASAIAGPAEDEPTNGTPSPQLGAPATERATSTQSPPIPDTPVPTPTSSGETALVTQVIDGDTIELQGGRRLRYIGIDTPETVDPNQPVGCYGKEASDRNRTLVEGKTVSLEKDVSETDRFGRLLRYVYLPSGEMVNEMLVVEGYAQASSFPPDIKHQERFNAAQVQARNSARGLWGPACAPTATPVPPTSAPPPPAPTQAPPPTMAPAPGGNCHPSYPTICLPPGRDVDCGEIPQYRNFTVLPPDPYRLDGNDNDGIGCETS